MGRRAARAGLVLVAAAVAAAPVAPAVAKEPIAGVTPFEYMQEIPPRRPPGESGGPLAAVTNMAGSLEALSGLTSDHVSAALIEPD